MGVWLMNEIVKYNNKMNQISFTGFTKTHMDLLMAICSKVKLHGTNIVTIKTQELKDITHFEKGGNRDFFEELDAMTEQLQKINGKIVDRTPGQRKFIKFVLFPTFEYDENGEWLTIAVNERFAWLLNEFESYTTFELAEFIGLKSKYAKNLYRIMKQWRNKGTYTFHDLEQFRELMDVPKTYTNRQLMQDCVNVAVDEISKLDKSFQNFKCTPNYARKRGKPLEKLLFTWDTLPHPQTADQTGFSDQQTFEEYIKDYQGEDKPTPLDIKIAKDIQKNRHNKESKQAKKNAFNNFEQREYDNESLEKLLFADLTEKQQNEQFHELSKPKRNRVPLAKQKNSGKISKKDMIHEYVLAHPNENVSQIAENLGISRTTVYKYMTDTKPKTSKQAKKDIEDTLEAPKAQKTEFEANTKPQKQIPKDETPEQRKKRHRREWEEKRKQQK